MDPENPKDLSRLRGAVRHARHELVTVRELRNQILKEYVGSHHKNGTADRVPVNLLALAINTHETQLAAKAPKALVSTPMRRSMPLATVFEKVLNDQFKRMRLGNTLRRAVRDAILSPLGIVKVGMEHIPGMSMGEEHVIGRVYADSVDIDDWVQDVGAKNWESIRFCGNRFRVPLEEAKSHRMYNAKARGRLEATTRTTQNENGDDRAEAMQRGEYLDADDLEPQVELMELWLPREKLLVTLACEGEDIPPLLVQEWRGPAGGPFIPLIFQEIANNAVGKPLASDWLDLHLLFNAMFNKTSRQALRQKSILPYSGDQEDDVRRVVDSIDGQTYLRTNGDVKEISFGGPDQRGFALMLTAKELLSYVAGNLDTLGGLRTGAETLGQEQLLAGSASRRIDDLQAYVYEMAQAVVEHIGYYLWNDPNYDPRVTLTYGQSQIRVPASFSPERRQMGSYADYELTIEPYSMQPLTPQYRLQMLLTMFDRFLPLAQLFAAQGRPLNIDGFLDDVAHLSHVDEVERLVSKSPDMPQQQMGEGEIQSPSVPTKRTYEHVSRPGATREGKTMEMVKQMMGMNTQQSESNQLFRPTG